MYSDVRQQFTMTRHTPPMYLEMAILANVLQNSLEYA